MLQRKQELKRCFIFPPHPHNASALPGETMKCKKLHLFFHMLYYCIARLRPVASLIYSVLLHTTNSESHKTVVGVVAVVVTHNSC